jgi:hypothetical protein
MLLACRLLQGLRSSRASTFTNSHKHSPVTGHASQGEAVPGHKGFGRLRPVTQTAVDGIGSRTKRLGSRDRHPEPPTSNTRKEVVLPGLVSGAGPGVKSRCLPPESCSLQSYVFSILTSAPRLPQSWQTNRGLEQSKRDTNYCLRFSGDFGGGGGGDRSTGANCCVSQASMITDWRVPL